MFSAIMKTKIPKKSKFPVTGGKVLAWIDSDKGLFL